MYCGSKNDYSLLAVENKGVESNKSSKINNFKSFCLRSKQTENALLEKLKIKE